MIAPERSPSLELVAGYTFRALEARGVFKLRTCTANEATARDLNWCDVLFAVRPANSAMAVLVSDAKRMQKLVMCHWDDDLLSIPPESSSHAYFSRPGVRKLTLDTLLQADVVLSSSEILITHLRALLQRHGKAHIPTHVLPVPALSINTKPVSNRAAEQPLTIGYAGSADQTDILQKLIVPALEKLWDAGHEIRLELIGPTLSVSAKWQKFVANIPVTENYAQWLDLRNSLAWDLALAPLNSGHFYSCKFHNKYLEFSAAEIPCIFSDVAPFNTVVRHGINGYLTQNTVADWTNAIRATYDRVARLKIAAAAKKDVTDNYQLSDTATAYEKTLEKWLCYRADTTRRAVGLRIRQHHLWLHANILRRYF